MTALVTRCLRTPPGHVLPADLGVLFLYELPDSQRVALETGATIVGQAIAYVTYPGCFQLVAAMYHAAATLEGCGPGLQPGASVRPGLPGTNIW